MPPKKLSLVADIGGTNARFALVPEGSRKPVEPKNLRCADYTSPVAAANAYLDMVSDRVGDRAGIGRPQQAVLSVASPVVCDEIPMTNNSWKFLVSATREDLGLESLCVINDYTALALSLSFLSAQQCIKIGGGKALPHSPKAVLGPGTGLGVSGVVLANGFWMPLESEGGHVSYGGITEREQKIIALLRKNYTHISAELLVSGSGLLHLYQSLAELEGAEIRAHSPSEVSELALDHACEIATEALHIFCEILGTVAGNLALTMGARGGVYIGGGIVLKILDVFKQSKFRERFEQHGRLTNYLCAVPTYVINTDYPALIGAIAGLDSRYDSVGVFSRG